MPEVTSLSALENSASTGVPVRDYVQRKFVPLSNIGREWEMHSAVALTPAEERTMVREPAQAIPESIAQRVGKVRLLLVPFIACLNSGDQVVFSQPKGEKHSAVWLESEARTDLVLACRDLDAHDTGFEFLASVAELLRSKLTAKEKEQYAQLLQEELRKGVAGEIDEEANDAKQSLRKGQSTSSQGGASLEDYRDISFVSTCAEYMHGLWHDVQIRLGPEHLPVAALRKRMTLMTTMFPPNPGYRVFAE